MAKKDDRITIKAKRVFPQMITCEVKPIQPFSLPQWIKDAILKIRLEETFQEQFIKEDNNEQYY